MTDDRTREQVRVALAHEGYAAHPDQLGTAAREWVDRVTARVMDAIRPLLAAPAVDREGLIAELASHYERGRSTDGRDPVTIGCECGWRGTGPNLIGTDEYRAHLVDALITAGLVGGRSVLDRIIAVRQEEITELKRQLAQAEERIALASTHGLTDDEVLALSATAKALSHRIDTALAVCDRADEFGWVMVGAVRKALAGQEDDFDVPG